MEIFQTLELTTPIGIATLTTILLELIKRQFIPNMDKGNRFYSLIIIGISFAIAGILSWSAVPMFDLSAKDALYNWFYGWMGATFGFELIKSAKKMIKTKN